MCWECDGWGNGAVCVIHRVWKDQERDFIDTGMVYTGTGKGRRRRATVECIICLPSPRRVCDRNIQPLLQTHWRHELCRL